MPNASIANKQPAVLGDYLLLHFTVVIWGLTAVLGKSMTLSAPVIVFWRTAIASLALAIILLVRREPLRLSGRAHLQMLGAGCLVGAHWLLFFLSVQVSSVSICLIGIATTSLWCAVLEPLIKRNHGYRRLEIALSLLAVLGTIIIFYGDPVSLPGLLIAILAALVVAIFSFINEHLIRSHPARTVACHEMGGACLLMAALLPITMPLLGGPNPNFWPDQRNLALLFVLALVCTVFAFTVSLSLLRRIPVFAFSLAASLEPVYGILLAAILLAEHKMHGPAFYLGGSLILASALAYPILNRKLNPLPPGAPLA